MDLTVRITSTLADVDALAWDALDHGASPFLRWGFLAAAEESGTIGVGTGWEPRYVLVERAVARDSAASAEPRLLGAVPVFLKHHSYGEYIFDWGWARASARAGIPYYPKLVIAAPMTPATGSRILLVPGLAQSQRTEVTAALVGAVKDLAEDTSASSIHWLFCRQEEQQVLTEHGFLPRASFQFHWRNRGYANFDAFLQGLSSRKRKQIRKERRRARAQVDDLQFVSGSKLSAEDLETLDRFYRTTVYRHGGIDYLRPGFFERLSELLPEMVQFARVRRRGETIAGALYLETEGGLYGRYWGSCEEIEFLHFETAYYAGIERCIERDLPVFEAGAQGEHKLLRGFEPVPTYSSHWIRHPDLRDAVSRFLREEARALQPYMQELRGFTPYKRE